jgi:hypothetical protein
MTFIVSNKEHQEHIKELALPVFAAVEKLLCVINANKDHSTYTNVQKAALDLNKTIFVFQGYGPTWDVESISKALHKLIQSVPRISRNYIPYQELENYLNTLSRPIARMNTTISFLDKIKQKFGFGKNPR